MPKPVAAAVKPIVTEETVDATQTAPETVIEPQNGSSETTEEVATKKRLPLTEEQQSLILKTVIKMRKGLIPGGVTPSSVMAHVKTLPAFAEIADKLTAAKISSTMSTLNRQRVQDIEDGRAAQAKGEDVPWLAQLEANPFPEFDRQNSPRLTPSAFVEAILAED